MAKPISILPPLDLCAILPGPHLAFPGIEFVFERKKCLLPHVTHVDRENTRTALLCCETQKPCSRPDVQNRFAGNRDATYIVVEAAAQVPVPADQTEIRQIHRVIE